MVDKKRREREENKKKKKRFEEEWKKIGFTYWADTRNCRDTILFGSFIELKALNTSTNLHSRARVRDTFVIGNILDILQVVSPDAKSILPGGPTVIVVAGVLHNQSQVESTSKIHS
jgi:hypothetical protein